MCAPRDARHSEQSRAPRERQKGGRSQDRVLTVARGGESEWAPAPQATRFPPPPPQRGQQRPPWASPQGAGHPCLTADHARQQAGPSLHPAGRGPSVALLPHAVVLPHAGPQPTPQHLPLGERTPRVQPACQGAELLRHPSAAASAPIRQRKTSEAQQESDGRLGGPDARPWAVCCLASGHFCLLLGRSETGRGRAALPSPAQPAWGPRVGPLPCILLPGADAPGVLMWTLRTRGALANSLSSSPSVPIRASNTPTCRATGHRGLEARASHPGSPRKGPLLSPRAQTTVPSLQPRLASPSHTTAGTLASPTLFAGPQGSSPPGTGPGKHGGAPEEGAASPQPPSPAQPRTRTRAPRDQTPPSPTHTHRPDRPQQHPCLPTAQTQPQPLRGPRSPALRNPSVPWLPLILRVKIHSWPLMADHTSTLMEDGHGMAF